MASSGQNDHTFSGTALVPADITSGHGWITILTSMFLHEGRLSHKL